MPTTEPKPSKIRHIEAKAFAFVAFIVALLVAFVFYILTARGVFEETRHLVLLADNSEGVVVGMDLSFSGFPIGRVMKIELGDDGKAHIHIDVPQKDARWLRTSSVFTLERGLVGGARLRAFTGLLDDPPLPDNAQREALIGDAAAGIPQLVQTVRQLVENIERMTATDAPLNDSLGHVKTLTGNMTGKHGALTGLLGEQGAGRVIAAIENSNRLLAKTETRLFGQSGLMNGVTRTSAEVEAAVVDVRGLLADARASLKKVDATLGEAQHIATNARLATDDLDALRNEIETSLRRISGLVTEINRKWPFAREHEVKLP